MTIDSSHQYGQNELPSDVFNVSNGDVRNFNGRAVKVGINNNGTRQLSDLGDYGTYQSGQDVLNAAKDQQNRFNDMSAKADSSVTDAINKYQTDTGSAMQKFGVNNTIKNIGGLTQRINDLATNDNNAGGGNGSDIGTGGVSSAGQVDAAINSRYLPQLTGQQAGLQSELAGVQAETAPDVAYNSLLANNITAEMSGLTSTQQTIMQGIIGKLNAGVSLTNTENTLGEQYSQAMLDSATQKTLEQLGAQYTPFSPGQVVRDPVSGLIINPSLLAGSKGYYNPQ